MARAIGESPLTNAIGMSYEAKSKIRSGIYTDFFDQLSDQRLAAVFLTQKEDGGSDRLRRDREKERLFRAAMQAWSLSTAAGALAALGLSCMLIIYAFVGLEKWYRAAVAPHGKFFRNRRWWLSTLLLTALVSVDLTNCFHVLGLNNTFGLQLQPDTSWPPIVRDFLIALALGCCGAAIMGSALAREPQGREGRTPARIWPWIPIVFYLAIILLMTYARNEAANQIIEAVS